eukprot:CAMPEP_0172749842 /NCGR_PEP_ID=MMETSP1074-20121228/148305_1 /TAXON_ID=2916 /ORGANISM="Ceratium fusus, Strain PA161109" /LENGTH=78 /DNA_ID=CAMNT_0013581877 /DNA_START=20 /DNA_END=256 /DNA_ORIENTATION=+
MTEKASKAYKFQRAEVVHPLSTSCPCVGPRGGSNMLGSEYEDALNDLQARGAEFKVDLDGGLSMSVPPCQESYNCTMM